VPARTVDHFLVRYFGGSTLAAKVVSDTAEAAPDAAWWVIPAALAMVAVFALSGGRADWAQWRRRDGVLSWRLRGLRNLVTRFCGMAVAAVTLLFPQDASATNSTKAAVVTLTFFGSVVLVSLLQFAVLVRRRSERQMDEVALRVRGLPVRKALVEWWVVGALWLLGVPVALALASPLLALPLALLNDEAAQAVGALVAIIVFGAWLVATPWLTLRQWRRQRAEEATYWRRYRAALHDRAQQRS
jgi:nitrate/nitrite transporter NarK